MKAVTLPMTQWQPKVHGPTLAPRFQNVPLFRGSTALFLDMDDIVDDDLKYLAQLRRQMENAFNSSPREITNRIKEFFATRKKSAEEIAAFRDYLYTNRNSIDAVNVILLLESCHRNELNLRELTSWGIMLDGMEKTSPLMTSSVIYRGLSALKYLSLDDPSARNFIRLLWERIKESDVVLNYNDICPAIYCLQSVRTVTTELRDIILYLAKCIEMTTQEFPSKSVCSAIFGLKRLKPVAEVRELVRQIALKIEQSDVFFHSVNVCIALDGLQSMDDSSAEVRHLLTALMNKAIPADEQGMDFAKDREISMALFGLQKMGITQRNAGQFGSNAMFADSLRGYASPTASFQLTPELSRVLRYLTSLLYHYDRSFEAKRLGFALMGISRLSSDLPEMRELIGNITVKARDAWGDINGQELSMCLHGMMSMHSDETAVRELVRSLTPLVQQCKFISKSDVRSALFGLQGMHSGASEVVDLCEAFAALVQRSGGYYNRANEISSSLYGLQGLNSDIERVKPLFREVARLSEGLTVPTQFDGRDVAMSLYGLRGSSHLTNETAQLIRIVNRHIRKVRGSFSTQDVANCFYGLQRVRVMTADVAELLDLLSVHVARATGQFNAKGLSMTLNGMQGFHCDQPSVRRVCASLTTIMRQTEDAFAGFDDFHQFSSALYGLSDLKTTTSEVLLLVDSLSNNIMRHGAVHVRGSRRTSVDPATSSYMELHRVKLKDTPKAEKVGLALFGLQGMSQEHQSVRNLVAALLDYIAAMPPPDGKVLGMSFQAFKSCSGVPSKEHEAALILLADKIPGWTIRWQSAGRDIKSERKFGTDADDIDVSIRSCLSGIANYSIGSPVVLLVLRNMAVELLANYDFSGMSAKTFAVVRKAYDRRSLPFVPEIEAFIDKLDTVEAALKASGGLSRNSAKATTSSAVKNRVYVPRPRAPSGTRVEASLPSNTARGGAKPRATKPARSPTFGTAAAKSGAGSGGRTPTKNSKFETVE